MLYYRSINLAILIIFLSSIFLFDDINQVRADSVIDTIPVGIAPAGVAYDSGNGEVYVDYFGSSGFELDPDTVYVIKFLTTVWSLQ